MKITAVAPSNIAFIKYWGKKDQSLRLPENGSISMCLSGMKTITTVEFDKSYKIDQIIYNQHLEDNTLNRAVAHLEKIRNLARVTTHAKVQTITDFPSGTGLSSSASGFAALTLACSGALDLRLSERELSIIARQGSGSACRSIPDGFVEWLDGNTSQNSYAYSIFPSDYWDIYDIVAVVSLDRKEVPTTEGMSQVRKSKFFEKRLEGMKNKIIRCKKTIKDRDFTQFGELIESEALEMHAVMLTQSPPLIYWTTGTLILMRLVQMWRQNNLECYFTLNTGQNIHIMVKSAEKDQLISKLHDLEFINRIIVNQPSWGARLSDKHLF